MRVVSACIGVCMAAGVAAAAPTADELRASGEQLAKAGRFTEAIAAFKASDQLTPRATNSCLIGLAYTRRELWSQAEIAIERCKQLASSSDPLPDWMPALESQLATRLRQVEVAPVEIVVEPPDAPVELSVSSFAPDELFRPRVIHVPPGRHVIVASATGYVRAEQTIEITDRTARRVVITLVPVHETVGARPVDAPPPPVVTPPVMVRAPVSTSIAPTPTRWVPVTVIAAGAGLVVAGAIYQATAFKTAADKLADATDSTPDPAEYNRWSHRFDFRREAVIGFYAAGAVALGVGLVLELRGRHPDEHPGLGVSVAPTPGGGLVTIGWSR